MNTKQRIRSIGLTSRRSRLSLLKELNETCSWNAKPDFSLGTLRLSWDRSCTKYQAALLKERTKRYSSSKRNRRLDTSLTTFVLKTLSSSPTTLKNKECYHGFFLTQDQPSVIVKAWTTATSRTWSFTVIRMTPQPIYKFELGR